MNFLMNGLLDLSVWGYIGATLLLTHITIVSVTVFLHRHQAHNALTLHPAVSHFFRFWLWLTTGMVTRQWVAVHRKHHAKCETTEDPHSPQVVGLKKVLLQGTELYRKEADNPETTDKYGTGTPNDFLERHLYSRYPFIGIGLMLAVDVLLFGVIGITIFAIQMLWIPFWAAGIINGVGHYWGYRNFETEDASRNIVPWGILIGGEELHNNHHSYGFSARLSNKWWEFDIGWFYIRLLEVLGLAHVKKISPRAVIEPDKKVIDVDTIRAVIRNRFHILKLYGRKVIKPVLKQQRRMAIPSYRPYFRKVSRLLIREGTEMDAAKRERLAEALNHSQALETVYRFKLALKEIWRKTSRDQADRVKRLQEWCNQAEASGIQALQDFACYLRGYTLDIR
jgi:stearoyl-CoA desaturase (delta-9 desaturase)